MIRNPIRTSLLSLSLTVLILTACGTGNKEETTEFDRKAFLEEVVHYVIMPQLSDAWELSRSLNMSIDEMIGNPTIETVKSVKENWKLTFIQWQRASVFNIGPAQASGLKKTMVEELGVFPVSKVKINEILNTGTYNLSDFNRDTRGISAMEYLLFGITDSDTLLAEKVKSDAQFSGYVSAVSSHFEQELLAYYQGWNTESIQEFVENNGTDAGSSTSVYYNEWVKSFEALKNFKVALPLGLRAGQTTIEPERIEGYFSRMYSIEALKAHYETIQLVWTGTENGIGFKGYLRSVSGGAELITATEAQFEKVNQAFASIESSGKTFLELVETQDESALNLFTELQKLTRYLKSDLSSLIGIAITYASSDGD